MKRKGLLMYYVYELIDPRDGNPFYVGKGKGNRIDEHEYEARRGVVHPKCDRIREIESEGLKVEKRIVREFRSEDAAYRYEKRLIKKIGLNNLTNLVPGGRRAFASNPADTQKAKDKNMLDVIAVFAKKTGGFAYQVAWRFCGERFEIPESLIAKIKDNLREIVDRHGLDWVNKQLSRSGVLVES